MSGFRKNRPLRPFAWLLLLGAVAFAAGCSTANGPGGGGTSANHIGASGQSVPGWLVVPSGGLHASTATRDFIASGGTSSCAECHGSDLTGGISRVSCFGNPAGCHHVPVAGWVAPPPAAQNHGISAKRAPGSSGFAACQICHGKNFSGGGAQTPCSSCHGLNAPHPLPPWRGSTYTHTNTDPANAPVCAQCHFPGSSNNPPNHPPAPAAAGTAPGCFNSTLCHGDVAAVPHPVGAAWVATPPAAQPHGNDAKATPASTTGFAYCQVCHGTGTTSPANFGGGATGVSCYPCHVPSVPGRSVPHAPAPWRASAGSTYSHTSTDTGNAAVCQQCHFPGSSNNPAGHPPTPAPVGTPPGCFNSTLCHNGGGGAAHPVPFNDSSHFGVTAATFPAGCSACHDVSAPTVKSGPVCQTCHVAASPLAAANCTSCHASPPNGGAPAGAAYPNIPGAHSTHIALTTAGTPVSCNTCHNGLGSGTLNHYDRAKSRVAPGDALFLATYDAQSGPSSFDNTAALSCSNVSCHGGQATPNWRTGTINVNTQCTSCHTTGTTTQFNGPITVNHNRSEHQVVCTICHNTTALAVNHFTNLGTPALEGPASATIGGAGTAITAWDPVTKSCDPTCHGVQTWQ